MKKAIILVLLMSSSHNLFAAMAQKDMMGIICKNLSDSVNKSDAANFRKDFSESLLRFMTPERSKILMADTRESFGNLGEVKDLNLTQRNKASCIIQGQKSDAEIKLVIDVDNKLVAFKIERFQTKTLPARNTVGLILPVKGEWTVEFGGDSSGTNKNYYVKSQRHAMDIFIMDPSSKTHKTDGKANEDYYAFSKEVYAPADGVVTDVIQGVRDNLPGSVNPSSAIGNAIMIKHAENEVSFLAHLQNGSITVKPGDSVKKGQLIGLCGNSGNSAEAHLHYGLMDVPDIQNATSIKYYFSGINLTRGGKTGPVQDYFPLKGDVIRAE